MTKSTNYVNTTDLDKYLAIIYFGILVELAKTKRMVTYGELVQISKEMYPDDELVQSGIPVSTGRRLEVVQQYLRQHNLPDLTSIVFNQTTNDCGEGIGHSNPSMLREAVFGYSWDGAYECFLEYLGYQPEEIKALILKKQQLKIKITQKQAESMMSEYLKVHKHTLPQKVRTQRNNIIRLLMDGVSVEQAFYECSQ